MATVFKGAINFGLINIPVKLSVAIGKESISFRMLHKKCKNPINQKRWCARCNEEVRFEEITKGYEYEKGSFVEIQKSDLEDLPVKSTKYIQIVDFIDISEVDPIYFDKSYYVAPEANAGKPYLILAEALAKSQKAAIAKITIRDKEQLCIIRIYEDIMLMNTMYFADEIKSHAEIEMDKLRKKNPVSNLETQMAMQLIQNLSAPFEPEKYHDEYREELLKIINKKIEGENIIHAEIPEVESTNFADILERLKESVLATSKTEKTDTKQVKKTDAPAKKTESKTEKEAKEVKNEKEATSAKTTKKKAAKQSEDFVEIPQKSNQNQPNA